MWFEWPYTDLHSLNLDWILNLIKQWQGTMSNLPEYVKEEIQKALEDENLYEIVAEALSENGFVLNVKIPGHDLTPAKGDGVTDDTAALTAMIEFAFNNNYPLLFPAGQYLVSGLTVSTDLAFIGFGATLFLKAGAVNPLITVTDGYLSATGVEFNGNIAGQADYRNVFVVDGGGFKLHNCVVTGGVDGIHANINTPSFITAVEVSNFTQYGLYLEGSSFVNANGITMNVASGGALRFMKIDCDNCTVSNFSSQASLPAGFEVTGNKNAIYANIPNTETTVNDSGTGNTWTITGKDEKRYFEGSASHTYQNLQENITGNYNATVQEEYKISSDELIFNPTNPLTYKEPTKLNDFFDYIEFKDSNETVYDVAVLGSYTKNPNIVCPELFGAKGDGITDDTNAVQQALWSGKPVKFMNNYAVSTVFIDNKSIAHNSHNITIDFNGFYLIGKYTKADNAVLSITTTYVTIRDIRIDCLLNSNIVGLDIKSTSIYQSQFIWIDGCHIRNAFLGVRYGDGTENAQSENCINRLTFRSVQNGILVNQPNGFLTITNSELDISPYEWSNPTSQQTYCVKQENGNFTISNSTLERPVGDTSCAVIGSNYRLLNCVMEFSATAFFCSPYTGSTSADNIIYIENCRLFNAGNASLFNSSNPKQKIFINNSKFITNGINLVYITGQNYGLKLNITNSEFNNGVFAPSLGFAYYNIENVVLKTGETDFLMNCHNSIPALVCNEAKLYSRVMGWLVRNTAGTITVNVDGKPTEYQVSANQPVAIYNLQTDNVSHTWTVTGATDGVLYY